ncbi:MAG TPA: TOBE domain-containing protein, partial [Symbiobacteriaceae bacterium]|nr:TOBE domain-containing protein [Symbiobacteriaceae bacterium]
FVGSCAFIPAHVSGDTVAVAGRTFRRPLRGGFTGDAVLGLRPEMLRLLPSAASAAPGDVALPGTVEGETFLGAFASVRVRLSSGNVVSALAAGEPGTYAAGAAVGVAFKPEAAFLFDARSGEAIR